MEFLGYHISSNGTQLTTEKVKAIQMAPQPSDITQLKSFLGAVNYYGKFLSDLATIIAPLYSRLKKDMKWCALRLVR